MIPCSRRWRFRRAAAVLAALAAAVVGLGAYGSTNLGRARAESAVVRQPTPAERTAIVAASISGSGSPWGYLATSGPCCVPQHRFPAFEQLHYRPKVISIRVSQGNGREFATVAVEVLDSRGRATADTAILVFEHRVRGGWQWTDGPATAFPRACVSPIPTALHDLLCPSPWSVLALRSPVTAAELRAGLRASLARQWHAVELPGAVCGATSPIHLHWSRLLGAWSGVAYVHSALWPWWPAVEVDVSGPTYSGSLTSDGLTDAYMSVVCSNGGGTADGQLAFADVVFIDGETDPINDAGRYPARVAGIITPRQPYSVTGSHVPLLGQVEIYGRGKVLAYEYWYGPGDGTCCASGRAVTIWTYTHGTLKPARTIVIVPPLR